MHDRSHSRPNKSRAKETNTMWTTQYTMSRCVIWNVCRKLMLHENLGINTLLRCVLCALLLYTNIFAFTVCERTTTRIVCIVLEMLSWACVQYVCAYWTPNGRNWGNICTNVCAQRPAYCIKLIIDIYLTKCSEVCAARS